MNIFIVVLGLVSLLQGCSYAISSSFADRADKTVTFEMLRQDPVAHKGKLLILGGTIVQSAVVKQGSLITIDQKPLDYWGKPTQTSRTGGQFLVYYSRLIASPAYAPGTYITVAAEVAGTKLDVLGNIEYDQPVLISREIKLWPKEQKRQGTQTQWGDPLYAPQRQPH
jgi:outer membrane lipoprotein